VYADDDHFMALIDHPDVLGFIETVLGPQINPRKLQPRIVRPATRSRGSTAIIPSSFAAAERPSW